MKKALYSHYVASFLAVLLLLFLNYFRYKFLYPFAATWDQVDFVLALRDFDLLKMQPHFPGYPYFILGGLLFAEQFQFGPESLSFFNHLMMLSSCIPIYFMAKQWISHLHSLLIVLVIQSLSYVSVIVAQPMSEGAALAVIFWFLWSILLASKKDDLFLDLLPFLLFSILLGIRLSYLSFGIGLLFHLYTIWKRNSHFRYVKLSLYLLAALMFQLFWFGALATNVGGFSMLWNVATGFSEGHFTEWGGTADEGHLIERLISLVFINIIWVGLVSENIILLILFAAGIGILIFQRNQLKMIAASYFNNLIIACTGGYFIWALIAQNIEKPRHILPLVTLLSFLLFIKLLQSNRPLVIVVTISWVVTQGINGIQLLEKQATEQPAVYQLEHYLKERNNEFVIYTWEETRTFHYLQSPFTHKRVFTYELFKGEVDSQKNQTIYLTDKVIEGFEAQGVSMKDSVRKKAEFHSDSLFDPVYADIQLYEWIE